MLKIFKIALKLNLKFRYEKALLIHKQILPENNAAIGGCLNKIGVIYRFQGDYKKALDHSLEALRLASKN